MALPMLPQICPWALYSFIVLHSCLHLTTGQRDKVPIIRTPNASAPNFEPTVYMFKDREVVCSAESGSNVLATWMMATGDDLTTLVVAPGQWRVRSNGPTAFIKVSDDSTVPLAAHFRCVVTNRLYEVRSTAVWLEKVRVIQKRPLTRPVGITVMGFANLPCIDPDYYEVRPAAAIPYLYNEWTVVSSSAQITRNFARVSSDSSRLIQVPGRLYIQPWIVSDGPLTATCTTTYSLPTNLLRPKKVADFPTARYQVSPNGTPPGGTSRIVAHSQLNIEVLEGVGVTAFCLFSPRQGSGYPVVQWTFTNQADAQPQPDPEPRRAQFLGNSSPNRDAEINFIATKDVEGTFRCTAPGTQQSREFTLTVLGRLQLRDEKGMTDKYAILGTPVVFACTPTKALSGSISWFINNAPLDPSASAWAVTGDYGDVLSVAKAAEDISRVTITCQAQTADEIASWNANVYTYNPPTFEHIGVHRSRVYLKTLLQEKALTAKYAEGETLVEFSIHWSYKGDPSASVASAHWVYRDAVDSSNYTVITSTNPYVMSVQEIANSSKILFVVTREVDFNQVQGYYQLLVRYDDRPELEFFSNFTRVSQGSGVEQAVKNQILIYILLGVGIPVLVMASGLAIALLYRKGAGSEDDSLKVIELDPDTYGGLYGVPTGGYGISAESPYAQYNGLPQEYGAPMQVGSVIPP